MSPRRLHILAARATAVLLILIGGQAVRAENISIPGFGDLTVFGTANVGVLVEDGVLGGLVEGNENTQIQNVNSLVGVDWSWDVGYSTHLIGHYEYGGDFTRLDRTFDDSSSYEYWAGFDNFLGTFTYGRQQLAFLKYYGDYIDQSQEFYATGYTTPFAGGLQRQSDLFKFSTSYGQFDLDIDYRPNAFDSSSTVADEFGIGGQYRQLLGRLSFGGAYDRQEFRGGGAANRYGGAIMYTAEQWSLAGGAHLVDDPSPSDTRSYNLLAQFQVTPNNAVHLSLATIDDDDVYDDFYGGGFYVDHRIGSQWTIYGEGAVTRVDPAGGGSRALNSQFLIGVRFDIGTVWY